MAQPATRAEFTDYCLRKLGAPVLEINVDDNQVDDLIDDAIQLYQEYHFDGVEKMFLKHCITDDDVTRFTSSDQNTIGSDDTPAPVAENTWIERDNFLQIPDHVIGISKVFGVSSGLSDNEMWGFANQYFLMDVFSFSSGYTFGNFDMSYFYMIKQWFETLDMVVNTGNLELKIVQSGGQPNQRARKRFLVLDFVQWTVEANDPLLTVKSQAIWL